MEDMWTRCVALLDFTLRGQPVRHRRQISKGTFDFLHSLGLFIITLPLLAIRLLLGYLLLIESLLLFLLSESCLSIPLCLFF